MVVTNRIKDPLQLYNEQYWKNHKAIQTKLDKKVAIIEIVNAMLKPKSYFGSLVCSHISITNHVLKIAMPKFVCNNIEVFLRVFINFLHHKQNMEYKIML